MIKFISTLAVLALACTSAVSAAKKYPRVSKYPTSPLAALKKNKNFEGFVELITTGGLTAFFSNPKFSGMIFVPSNQALNEYYKFVKLPLKTRRNKNWAANFVKAHTTFTVFSDYKKIKKGRGVTLKVNDGGTVYIARTGNNAWRMFSKRDPQGSPLQGSPNKFTRTVQLSKTKTRKVLQYVIQQIAGAQGPCTTPWEFLSTTPGFTNYIKLVRYAGKLGASPFSGKDAFNTYLKTNKFGGTLFIPDDAAFNAFFPAINTTTMEAAIKKLGKNGVYGLLEGGIISGTRLQTSKFPTTAKPYPTPVTGKTGWQLLVGKKGIIDETEAIIKVKKGDLLACQTLIHIVDTVIQADVGM